MGGERERTVGVFTGCRGFSDHNGGVAQRLAPSSVHFSI